MSDPYEKEKYKPHLNGYYAKVDEEIKLHRRPLYPPADKSMICREEDLGKIKRITFRPLVMTYNVPRFVFDFHSAGGLLGHLMLGVIDKNKKQGKWLHEFEQIEVTYSDGVVSYNLKDDDLPELNIRIDTSAAADYVGSVFRIKTTGNILNRSLFACYGGASAYYTRKDYEAPEYVYDPIQSKKDKININENYISLIREFDLNDVCMNTKYMIPKYLSGYKADIRIISSKKAIYGAAVFSDDAYAFIENVKWTKNGEYMGYMGVVSWELENETDDIYLLAGMGKYINTHITDPSKSWENAITRNTSISGRVRIKTPDHALDNAVSMLSFCLEGLWGDEVVLHGALSWRNGYLGWRSWYGSVCYGWEDRIRRSIENFTTLGLVKDGEDKGSLSCLYEPDPYVYYNMNEVFLDQVRQYFDYTNDIELIKKIFPVLKSIINWENKRLKPGDEDLYESCLNTWISDGHWYIKGQCAQASAYMLNAYRFLSYIAKKIGEDDSVYIKKANSIYQAMQDVLWIKDEGVYAEAKDTQGRCMLHPEPELPTIYHTAEFGAASDMQIDQMLNWANKNLRQEKTYNGGKLYWSANWYPNNARSYTHSTYEMAYAEELNFALTNYLGAKSKQAYDLLSGALCGFYSGPTPGGLPCHADVDGRQRRNDEFADAISMFARTVYEGLFGIKPKKPDDMIQLSPQFPKSWENAYIDSPHLKYVWNHIGNKIEIVWEAAYKTRIKLEIPFNANKILSTVSDNEHIAHEIRAGIECSWLSLMTKPQKKGSIVIKYEPASYQIPKPLKVKNNSEICINVFDDGCCGYKDPQNVLSDCTFNGSVLKGIINTTVKSAVIYTAGGTKDMPCWIPNRLEIDHEKKIHNDIWESGKQKYSDGQNWGLICLDKIYNAASPIEVLKNISASAVPPKLPYSQIGFEYLMIHIDRYCINGPYPPSDVAFRSKTGDDDIYLTTENIPFATSKAGRNLGIVTRLEQDKAKTTQVYPVSISFDVNEKGSDIYLLITGMTYPAQSHVPNIELEFSYEDSTKQIHQLINPFGIGECWGTWHGRYHDTQANGFENIGGRFGPLGSAMIEDITKPIYVDTEAHIIRLSLKNDTVLTNIKFEAAANDVIFGIMGVSIKR